VFVAVACVVTGVITPELYPRSGGPDPLWLRTAFAALGVGIVVAVGSRSGRAGRNCVHCGNGRRSRNAST
jgi:hypothetical protein